MIQQALKVTNQVLDQFIMNRFALEESKVVTNSLVDNNGSIPELNKNKVIITLINLEKETARPYYNDKRKMSDGNYTDTYPSERFNLDIMFCSNFDDYNESLKFLDAVLVFFQSTPTIDQNITSDLPPGLVKLDFDIEQISYFEMHNLWSSMGANYQPSAIYKTRLITIDAADVSDFSPAITTISNTGKVNA